MEVYNAFQNQEEATASQKSLRKQLAVAVRGVQWSYAILWSLSTTQQGVLEWGDGYYNGDIKKRKKGQDIAHKFLLERSKQLRQLYLSMLEGETDQSKTALSPDDLSDEEWYYLVCMSYVFHPGQGLPGRALANGETIWLCNAQYAESKQFSRSLLAGSASIQTVVCFPCLGGVVELGVTELVAEDASLLQYIKACLLDFSKPDCYGKYSSASHNQDDDNNDKDQRVSNISHRYLQELEEGNHMRLSSMDLGPDEVLHYRRTVSAVLKQAKGTKKNQTLDRSEFNSSFLSWKKRGIANAHHRPQVAQNLLRKILYIIPSMHCANRYTNSEKENYAFSDKRRENEKFRVLKSMVPSIKEINKESILNDTIKYLKELEARVEELESCMGSVDYEARGRRTHHPEMVEETSDNYEYSKFDTNKRKACDDFGETVQETNRESDGIIASEVKVKVKEQGEVLIEIRCPYREYIVADIMDAISNLLMDAYSVRSSTLDGFLTLNLKAKFRGAAVAPAGMIKRELGKVAGKCYKSR